jgi:glutaminyl-tRNA synthetase
VARLENALRDDLNRTAPRAMGVLRPLELVIDNWPMDPHAGPGARPKVDMLEFVVNPEDPGAGTRLVPFDGTLLIERDDFMEVATSDFYRLAIGQEVRLRWAYFVTATSVEKDAAGNVTRVHATYDPLTRGGDASQGPDDKPVRKVKGTIHWISRAHAVPAEARLYDRLFRAEFPGQATGNWMDDLNPQSLEVVDAMVEPTIAQASPGATFQLERLGYFCIDTDARPGACVLNRTMTLKDASAAKGASRGAGGSVGGPGGSAVGTGTPQGGKTYSFGQTAHTLKISKEKLAEVLVRVGLANAPADVPQKLSQGDFEKVRKALAST